MKAGFIGNGRICRAFSTYIEQCGIEIVGRYGKQEIYSDFSRGEVDVKNMVAFAQQCDLLFITTPDDTIHEIAEILAVAGVDMSGKLLLHMSGSLESREMDAMGGRCAGLYSLHPMTSITGDPLDFSKVHLTLEGAGTPEAEAIVAKFLHQCRLHYTRISGEHKLLYHAASCISANYTVTLVDIALAIYRDIGFDDAAAQALVVPLMRQVMENIAEKGTKKALTGPISRGDIGTLNKHLAALRAYGKYEDVYRLAGSYTADVSLAAGNISRDKAAQIHDMMRQ